MSDYLSYNEILDVAIRKERCCECHMAVNKKEPLWFLVVSEQGARPQVFKTCGVCRAMRVEFCLEHFTPSQLLQDLEALRSALSYDSVRPWAMLTNAISLLKQRRAGAGPVPRVPTTPTPLRGIRTVHASLIK